MSNFDKIRQWAADRNLIEGATPQGQFVKLMEEAGELAAGIAKSRQEAVVDGIGDMVVVLTILAAQHGVTIEDCIATAYNEIKDRKGRMVGGIFVKESDIPTHGWIEWAPVINCPVARGTLVEVKYRDGGVAGPFPALENVKEAHRDAGDAFWKEDGLNNDIVAYRLIKP